MNYKSYPQLEYSASPIAVKEMTEDADFFKFAGYGSTFGNKDLGDDIVVKGAFKKSLGQMMPKLLYQHDMKRPAGVIVDAREDEKGLFIEGQMPKALPLAQEIMCLIKCKAIDSFSIGYSAVDSERTSDGTRNLKEVDLWEVSFVTLPMNPSAKLTSAKGKNITELKDQIKTKRDLEHFLRESGLVSKEGAVWLASCFDLPEGDPSAEEKADEIDRLMAEFMDNLKKPI